MKIHQSTPSIPTGLEALKSDLQKDITHLQEEGAAIDKRHEDLIKRHQSISENNGGADTKPSDMITLNVSGTEMFARRDTLTAVKGSRLDALFSGRWENRLLRDEKGRVFMDADPSVFGKIVKYLKMVKLSASHSRQGDVRAKPLRNPTMSGSYEKKMFDLYLEIFHLQDQATAVSDTVQEVNTNNYEDALTAKMKKMRAELDEAEKRIQQEESFVSCFVTKDSHDHQEGYSSDDLSQWSVDSNDSSDITIDGTTSPASKRTNNRMALDGEALGILNLCIDGQMMAVKRSTLCLDPESKLARDFSNNDWLYDHKVASENGKTMFVVDHSAGAFKAMVHHLQVKSMIGEGDDARLPSIEIEDEFEKDYFEKMHILYFGHNVDFMKLKSVPLDTTILEEVNHEEKIKEWLGSVGRGSDPKLLYRASRDGWEAKDFHGKCDGKGATVVLVKSEEGYVFGGYSDVSWSSPSKGSYKHSKEAFLFSLKCHAGLPPVKMSMKKGHETKAVYHSADWGTVFGDIYIGSNPNINDNNHTLTSVGSHYELPNGVTDQHFLTGSKHFKVSEYEVFHV